MLITVEVPNHLGQRLNPFKNQLPQVLELGLREINTLPKANALLKLQTQEGKD